MPVRTERTGWRDEAISRHHRLWGFDCPAADIDFLVAEYDLGKVKALVEYKHEAATVSFFSSDPSGMHPKSYQALNDLANRADIPFFVVIYKSDFTLWLVIPMNRQSKNWFREPTVLSEKEWVSFLYKIRGRLIPQEILKILR